MTTIPGLGQTYETCGGVKKVKCVINPPPMIGQLKKIKKKIKKQLHKNYKSQ